jgi:hypothetical protein
MNKLSFVTLLVVGATILGATVLREPIAYAAQSIGATIVGPLDAQGNVKTHEQGIASVDVTNASVPVQQAGEPITLDLGFSDQYTVPSNKRLVIQFVDALSDRGGGLLVHVGRHFYSFGLDIDKDVVSETVTIFAQPEDVVSAQTVPANAGDSPGGATLTGYLVDA